MFTKDGDSSRKPLIVNRFKHLIDSFVSPSSIIARMRQFKHAQPALCPLDLPLGRCNNLSVNPIFAAF